MAEDPEPERCRHDATTHVARARAGELVPRAELAARKLLIELAPMRRCERCRALLVSSAARREVEGLADALVGVARAMSPTSEVCVRLGRVAPTTDDEQRAGAHLAPRAARFDLSAVVHAEPTRLELDEALAKVRNHELIYERWGFGAVDPVGRGVTLNLHGPPGVGKSRTAEALAGELARPFLALTAGDLESRFMGETPRNVKAAFAAASQAGALLFFDEADSLLGKRASDVTQGIDHEINATKSTLLVEMERFEGVLVVATNLAENFDGAFVRRLTHNIRIRLPDAPARRRLWAMHVPATVPIAIDREALLDALVDESEGLSGGDILTAMRLALPAVVMERGPEGPLDVAHVVRAIDRIRRARREVGRMPSAGSAAALRRLLGPPQSTSTAPATPDAPAPPEPLEQSTEG